ncbi:MAG: FtsX-like permease family protein [Longimicrobiales bacterium]
MGGALGLLIAYGALDLIGSWLAETIGTKGGRGLQYFDPADMGLSWGVAAFAVLLSTLTGLAFGLLPAWQASRTDPNASLRGARGREQASSLTHRGRDGLLVMQVGIAIVLLTGATLMLQNLGALQRFDLGYDRDGLFTAMYSLTATDEFAGIDPARFHLDALDRVRALPGVSGATLGEVPQGGPTWRTIVLASEGRPELTPETHTWIRIQPVPDGYFDVMGIPLLEGRGIEATDNENAEPVVVISELAAEELFPEGSPIGRRITLAWPELGGDGALVVGVVPQVTFGGLDQPPERQAYASLRQAARLETGVVVRSEIEPTQLTRMVAGALAELGRGTALTGAMSMDERLVTMTARPRVIALLLSVFGALSAFLVATGLYGTLSYMVTRRTKELGLRISLGADRTELVMLVVRQGLLVTLTGLVLGAFVAALAGSALEPLMLSPGGADWPAIAVVSLVLLAVAVAAALLPAMRATRVDPMVALRTD